MRKLTLSTLLLSSIVITACSGGGGGGDNNHSNPIPETKLTNSDLTISKDAFKKGELKNISVRYGNTTVGELSGYNRTYSFNGAFKKEEGKDIEALLVDGTAKIVIEKGADAVGAAAASSSTLVGGLASLAASYALTAAWNASKDPTRDIFYFGYETPEANIPQKGVVTYKGNATRYDNRSNSVKNIGTSELIANFDTKKIKGELSMDASLLDFLGLGARDISLKETDIKGNSFSGKAVAEGNLVFFISREGQYEGKFFGPNAEEVAGKATFDESVKDLNTSFSAERTK